ncbi:MAG: zinc ribbon domain-containing protein [Chloroflexota bacterium]|nr:zinc ribbon domain-containing protein [Chloroflexota bacterium]
MTCPYCRTRNQPYAAFCLECGEVLGAAAPSALRRVIVRGPATSVAEAVRRLRAAGSPGARWMGGGVVVAIMALAVALQSLHGWQATGYRTGQRAEREHQWEAALAAYGQLGNYSDAAARSFSAQIQINTRNQFIAVGQAAANNADWARALTAWQGAAAIAPDYGDLPARLAQAQREIAARAAAGLIYRTVGPDAGLYLQGALGDPAARLPHSDAAGAVLAFSRQGDQAVYDGAAMAGGDRTLYLAHLKPQAGTIERVQPLPATLSPNGWGVFCGGGFWWMSETAPTLSFYSTTTGQATAIPFAPGVSLLATAPLQSRLLLQAAYSAADGPHSRLVLTAHDGSDPLVLSDDSGTIRNATLSPDGRWVLYERERRGALIIFGQSRQGYGLWWPPDRPDAVTTRQLLRWIDPDDGTLPRGPGGLPLERERMLDHLVLPDDAPDGGSSTGAFAPGRPATVVVNHNDRTGREISIYEAATGVQTSFWPGPAPAAAQAGPFFSPGGTYLLVIESAPGGAQVRLRPLDGSAQPTTRVVPVPAPAGSLILSQITLHDDALLTLVSPPHSGRASVRYLLTRRPLGAAADSPAQPLFDALYRAGLPDQPTITLAPSGTLLAYIRPDGTLIGQPLSAAPPLTLATAVRDVWSPLP